MAIYYLADDTPESAIKQAEKVFGDENAHILTLSSRGRRPGPRL
ncbi:hypothetical protein [Streptomyces sp. NPDC050504]